MLGGRDWGFMRKIRTIIRAKWGLISKCNLLSVVSILFFLLPIGNADASELDEPAGPAASPNYALQYDGTDDFVRVLDIGNFDFDTTFTVEAWSDLILLPVPACSKPL